MSSPASRPSRFSRRKLPHALALAAATLAAATAQAADFFWSSGDFITGTTAPEPLLAGDTLFIQSGGVKRFVGTSFTNQGLVRWQSDALQGGSSASVLNSGTWQSESDSNSFLWTFGGQPTFTNTGTFRKTAGVNTNVGTWAFINNGGLIDAQVGSITFNAGYQQFNAGSRFTGAGGVIVSGGGDFNGAFESDSLTLGGGTFNGAGASFTGGVGGGAGTMGWTAGDLAGSWTIGADASVTGSGAAAKRQNGSSITNNGLFVYDTTQQLQGGNSAVFTNNGTIEARQSATFSWIFGGAPTYVNNASGTVRATNNATLTFGTGNLTSNGGLFTADAGSAIVYTSASDRFNGGTRFVGENRSTGTARFVHAIQSDDLRFVSGTQIGGDGTPGSNAVLMGQVRFQGGDLQGAWVIDSGSTVTGEGAAAKRQVGSNITNDGLFVYDTTQQLQGGNSSVFTNNGTVEVRQSANFSWIFGGAPTYVNNASGTVRATNNATLTFGTGVHTSNGGLFTADAGSAIVFTGASNRFNDGTRFAGDIRVNGSARYVDQIQAGSLTWVNGTQTGGTGAPGSFGRLNGAVEWEGGDVEGAFEITAGATLRASTGTAKRQVGGQIVNNGTMVWDTTAVHQTGNSSRLENNGRYEFTQDSSVIWGYGGQGAVDNAGLIVKTGGAGTSSLANIALTNNGTIDVQSGAIALPTSFANAGTLMGTGAFNVAGTLTNNGHIAPGGSTGTLTLNTNLVQGALGTLDTELTSLSDLDLLLVNGNVALNGTLALSCFGNCLMGIGDEVMILDATGQLSGSFASVTMAGFGTGDFEVIYDLTLDRVLLRVTEGVTPVPEPGTYALLAAGLGLIGFISRRRQQRL